MSDGEGKICGNWRNVRREKERCQWKIGGEENHKGGKDILYIYN